MISVRLQGKPFNVTVIQVYAPTSNAEEAEVEQFYEDLQDLLELTPQKDVLFIIGDWNAKVGSQEIPGVTANLALEYRKNEGMEPKQKQHPAVDVTGDRSKVRCCKEQYRIGTWNVRSMNQGKLEVVKQEMARVNVDIVGIHELKWTGMGEFNSDDHYTY